MKEQFEEVIKWIRSLKYVRGCITGSSLLEIFEDSHQDVDVFVYDEQSFNEIFYAMLYNPMFTVLDPIENWKTGKFRNNGNTFYKTGIQTIKFTYNTCVQVNIILKKKATNIYEVLSSFDLDIVCRGIDLESGQLLDLTNGSTITKIASWNKINTAFYDPEIWEISRVLRQFERIVKYHKRGYNTDEVALKYIELIDSIQEYQNIFNSDNFTEKLKITKENTKIMKQILEKWLETHEISDDTLELVKIKIKDI